MDKSCTKGSPVRQSFAKINIFSSLLCIRFFTFPLSPRIWKRSRPSLSVFMLFNSFFSLRLSCIPSLPQETNESQNLNYSVGCYMLIKDYHVQEISSARQIMWSASSILELGGASIICFIVSNFR